MDTNTVLEEKRAVLKMEMAGDYRSFGGVILDGTGHLLQGITAKVSAIYSRKEPGTAGTIPTWYSATVLIILNLLIGYLLSLVLGELYTPRAIQLSIWAASTGVLILIANRITIRMFLTTYREAPLEAMLSAADLVDLQSWLKGNFDLKKPLFFGLTLGPILGITLLLLWRANNDEGFTLGLLFILIVTSIQAVSIVYYLFPFFLALPARISQYRFKLYTANPSSSEVVSRLSTMFTQIMYITIVYVVVLTLGLFYFDFLTLATSLLLGLTVWAPTVVLFISSQISLANIITNAKWETLIETQSKIETLQAQNPIPSQAVLEHIDKLMNYHDRIKDTPNSAVSFNFRAGLSFVGLLLPLITFVLTNLVPIFSRTR